MRTRSTATACAAISVPDCYGNIGRSGKTIISRVLIGGTNYQHIPPGPSDKAGEAGTTVRSNPTFGIGQFLDGSS